MEEVQAYFIAEFVRLDARKELDFVLDCFKTMKLPQALRIGYAVLERVTAFRRPSCACELLEPVPWGFDTPEAIAQLFDRHHA